MTTHEFYMKRCIELAKNGLGTTYPNPLVGSVIVHQGKIIGEGWHKKAGETHAEVNAVNSVKDKSLLKEATIYVSLEPCSHFGKTPPCCNLIIANEIPNVVVGTIDPFAKVAGNGIKKLVESGKNVTVGILEDECNELNKRFFTFHQKQRPYIILKWAETADGFIAPEMLKHSETSEQHDKLKPVWITNQYSRQLVHKWRTEEQAILVGTNTVLNDNPKLDARDFSGNNPIRVVLDKSGKVSKNYHVKDNSQKTIFITESEKYASTENCNYENTIFDVNLVRSICDILYKNNIQSIIIEGGTKTIQSFIDANLWDEARVFRGKKIFQNGIIAPIISGNPVARFEIMNDELKIFKQL
jgi:diaminohydroxyphosphoribosylaminopyrimidine deaminase / 5-amino-6-(5-phosphoribosylamino)uracil reductase